MPVGARVVLGPHRVSKAPVAIAGPAVAAEPAANLRIHQPREGPFAGSLPVRRERKIVVFDAWIFTKGFLISEQRAQDGESGQKLPGCLGDDHIFRSLSQLSGLSRCAAGFL